MREAGALLICETTVEELLMDGNRCIGVRCDRMGGEVYADVVVLADGVNSTLARKAGFHGEIQAKNVALAVKEILFMPEETIQQRFNIGEEEGVVIEMMGSVTEGMVGTGFLYTNKDSLTIGVGCMLSDFKANPNRTTPYALLEKLKKHPSIAPLIEGGEVIERLGDRILGRVALEDIVDPFSGDVLVPAGREIDEHPSIGHPKFGEHRGDVRRERLPGRTTLLRQLSCGHGQRVPRGNHTLLQRAQVE